MRMIVISPSASIHLSQFLCKKVRYCLSLQHTENFHPRWELHITISFRRDLRMKFLVSLLAVLLLSTLTLSQQEAVGVPWTGGKGVTQTVDQIMTRSRAS